MVDPSDSEAMGLGLEVICSIQSPQLKRIVFTNQAAFRRGDDFWTKLDNILVELVRKQPKNYRTDFTMEFWKSEGVQRGFYGGGFLPNFVQEGQMIVYDLDGQKEPVYISPGAGTGSS